jgi:hypothetical protein
MSRRWWRYVGGCGRSWNAKGRWTLEQWAAAKALQRLLAGLMLALATLVAYRPEQPPPAPSRGLYDPPEEAPDVRP